ncbi:MAG: CDP-alcohol phosphatidyltransferase family protein [Planctomycetota bacterium]|nr:CDP-alcohol phosphatidyltransferase family protein [Planctomycetota bacterium]
MRFRRRRGLKHGLLQGVSPLPTLITLGNLIFGFGAISLAVRTMRAPLPEGYPWAQAELMHMAAMCIIGAMICDALDGHVARWTGATSRFGMELDSLADLCSFGIAPAVLAMAVFSMEGAYFRLPSRYVNLPERYVWIMLAIYVACAAVRLARFNVEAGPVHSDHFSGLPSPAAAGCVASLIGLNYSASSCFFTETIMIALPLIMLLLGILMITRLRYVHLMEYLLRGRRSFMYLAILLLLVTLTVMVHELVLAIGFNLYMFSGIVAEFFGESAVAPEADRSDEAGRTASVVAGGSMNADGGQDPYLRPKPGTPVVADGRQGERNVSAG